MGEGINPMKEVEASLSPLELSSRAMAIRVS